MSDFAETVQRVIDRSRKARSLYQQNETATRNQVVDPMLRCLGWDTEDPGRVQPNHRAEDGVPDYTFFLEEKKVLFVEAKKMSVDVEDRQVLGQLAKYCFSEGMAYGLLTNGVVWILFRAFEEGTTLAERVVWKADIEHDDITAVARKLNTISPENILNVNQLLKKLVILDEVWDSVLDDPKNLAKGIAPIFQALAKDAHPDYELSSEEIEDFIQERLPEILPSPPIQSPPPGDHEPQPAPPPGKARTARIEHETFVFRFSYDLLVNTAEWLIKRGKLRKDNCPVVAGHKRYLVNIEAKHRYGDDFRAPKPLSNGLFIETHFCTSHCIIYSRKLLELCGFKGSLLEVLS
jgi:hypothetical protein